MKTKAIDVWSSKKREPKFINNLSNKDFKQLQSSLQREEEQLGDIEKRLQQIEAALRLLLANQLLSQIPSTHPFYGDNNGNQLSDSPNQPNKSKKR